MYQHSPASSMRSRRFKANKSISSASQWRNWRRSTIPKGPKPMSKTATTEPEVQARLDGIADTLEEWLATRTPAQVEQATDALADWLQICHDAAQLSRQRAAEAQTQKETASVGAP